MRNLMPLTRYNNYWDNIVNNKRPLANRATLVGLRPVIRRKFVQYSQLARSSTLQGMPISPFAPNPLLESCYSDSNNLSALKTDIKEKQLVLLRGECQYCNIGEPNTFDHYLYKSSFPEFSALSLNLVPCCSACNSAKGSKWLIGGHRTAVSLYFDTLPVVQYLFCRITFRGGVPVATYSINSALIPGYMAGVISNHYTELNLLVRYKERSNNVITDVVDAITPFVGTFTRAQIQNQLRMEAINMQASRGVNYWRAITKLELANSLRFLRHAGFP
jgi:5-methylcytosine-specific restriction endonuclease McrA